MCVCFGWRRQKRQRKTATRREKKNMKTDGRERRMELFVSITSQFEASCVSAAAATDDEPSMRWWWWLFFSMKKNNPSPGAQRIRTMMIESVWPEATAKLATDRRPTRLVLGSCLSCSKATSTERRRWRQRSKRFFRKITRRLINHLHEYLGFSSSSSSSR